MANVISGRQLIINTTGLINIPCNIKVVDGFWQDATTIGHTFSFTDIVGRSFTWKCTQPFYPTNIGKLDWLSGPITITEIDSGVAYLILGNK